MSCNSACYNCCSTLEQLQLANETLQTENKRLMSEMDELRTQVDSGLRFVFIKVCVMCAFFLSVFHFLVHPHASACHLQAFFMLHY